MKNILFIIIFISNLAAATPLINLNGIYFYDVKEVLNYSSQNDRRKIILIFSSSNCSRCVSFKANLASLDAKTKRYLSSKYIFSLIEDDIKTIQMFKVTSTPTIFIMRQNKKFVVAPMVGEPKDISEFVNYLIKISAL